jgi:hypothetical protein
VLGNLTIVLLIVLGLSFASKSLAPLLAASLIASASIFHRKFSVSHSIAIAVIFSSLVWLALMGLYSIFDAGPLTFYRSVLTIVTPVIVSRGIVHFAPNLTGSKDMSRIEMITACAPSFLGFIIVLVAYINKGVAGFAWALSGDARNHLLLSRQIIDEGGVTLQLLSWYPPLGNVLLSLSSSIPGRGIHQSSQSLIVDFTSIGLMTFSLLSLVSILSATIAANILSSSKFRLSAILFSALAPFLGFVSGVAFQDGFYPALFAIATIELTFLVTLLYVNSESNELRSVCLVALVWTIPLALSIWTFVALVPFVLFLWLFYRCWKSQFFSSLKMRFLIANTILSASFSLALVIPVVLRKTGSTYVALTGSIQSPKPIIFLLFSCFLVMLVLLHQQSNVDDFWKPLFMANFFVGVLILAMVLVQKPSPFWNYYPAKLAWIWESSLLWIFPVATCLILSRDSHAEGKKRVKADRYPGLNIVQQWIPASMPFVLPLTLVLAIQPWQSPFVSLNGYVSNYESRIINGWHAPSNLVVDKVVSLMDQGEANYVFWDAFNPSDDRLGNFLLALTVQQRDPGYTWPIPQIGAWAYLENPTEIASLCELISDKSVKWTVITNDANLNDEVFVNCGIEISAVRLDEG